MNWLTNLLHRRDNERPLDHLNDEIDEREMYGHYPEDEYDDEPDNYEGGEA